MVKIARQLIPSAGENVEQLELTHIVRRGTVTSENCVTASTKDGHMQLVHPIMTQQSHS